MSDQQLELRLRAWYGKDASVAETAPPALRASVLAIPRTAPRPLLRIDGRRNIALVAAAVLVAVAVAGAMLVGGLSVTTVQPSPSTRATATAFATTPAPTPTREAALPIAGMLADWRQVFAASDSVAWVVNPSAAYRTDDLGATWRDVTPPGFAGGLGPLTIVDADTAYAAPAGTPTTIYATHDAGLHWAASTVDSVDLSGSPELLFRTSMTGTALFTRAGSKDPSAPGSLIVYATSDGGTSWSRLGIGALPLLDGFGKWQGPSGGYLWESTGTSDTQPFDNHFFLSADGGMTWSQYTFPISAISPRNALKEIVAVVPEPNGRFLIAIRADAPGHDLAIYESTDHAAGWRSVDEVPGTAQFSIQFLTPTTWILASPEEIRTTVDAGAHWTTVTPAPYLGFWHVHFATTRTGWARVGGTGAHRDSSSRPMAAPPG